MTVATETWYTGFHPYTLEKIFSAKSQNDKLAQRQFFFWYMSEKRSNIIKELRRINRSDLIDKLFGDSSPRQNLSTRSSHHSRRK